MKLEEADPPKPGPGEVLIQVKAAGVNPVDTYVRAGTFGYSPKLPYTPGADGAGIVEAVGEGVRGISVGDRVYGGRSLSGSYAEGALFDAGHVHPLPENVSFAEGACIGIPYCTAYWALFQKAKVKSGEVVLVHGASGGVGTACVQIARERGLTVIGTAGTERGRQLVKEQGADHVLDHHDPAHYEEILKLTKGQGVSVILEMLANENLGKDLKVIAPFGRIVIIGSRGTVQMDPRDAMFREATLLGTRMRNITQEQFRQIHNHLMAGLKKGTLNPVVGRELSLAQAPQAHHDIMEKPAFGHIVLIPG